MQKDYLKIQNAHEELNIGINFGYVDRVSGVFNFQKNKIQNITAYKLSLDIENASGDTLRELESIIKSRNSGLDAVISLDGIISMGKAKIAQMFSFEGVSYDVEIVN